MLINADHLTEFAVGIFERLGARPEKARETADHLVL